MQVRVSTKRTDEEMRASLFGPIQEAARQPYQLTFEDVDPRKSWCELSELRLAILICSFKPCGINKAFNMAGIVEHMSRIFDNEHSQAELFLSDEDRVRFRSQQRRMIMGACPEREDRKSFAPKYMCRPSSELISKKLSEWFGMEYCEENESFPNEFSRLIEFLPPDFVPRETKTTEKRKKARNTREDAGSPVVVTSNKKKRIPTSED